jgi:putative PIN family toxin of toxin-antitoxin system
VRVVLDTNILVSAYNFPGGMPELIYRLALEGRVDLVTSRPLLGELARVLSEKFAWTPDRVEQAVAQVLRVAILVEPAERVRVVKADPDDDRVLEAALEGRADVIISGDKHLLRLESWRGIEIVKAVAFLTDLEWVQPVPLKSGQEPPSSVLERLRRDER